MTRHRILLPALAGVIAFLCASCDVHAPTVFAPRALGPSSATHLLGEVGLFACTPMPADSATALVGPDGGTINVGPHSLRIPAGALDSVVSITAIAPTDTINRVTFQPTGLTFQHPATLTMSYANCPALGGLPLLHRIAYIDSSLDILDLLASFDNLFTQKVSSPLNHFSDYAVAW